MPAQFYIEQWEDKQGATHLTKVKPINEFNRKLAKSKYGFKTIAVFRITPKPGIIIASYDQELKTTIVENAQ